MTGNGQSAAAADPLAGHATERLRTPGVRTLLWLSPYGLIILVAGTVHLWLMLPTAAVCAAVYAAYQRLHADNWWRYPAGWLLSLLLLAPCLFLVGYQSPWPALLVALPGLILLIANGLGSGRVARWWSPQPVLGSILYALLVVSLAFVTRGCGMAPPTDDVLFRLYAAPEPAQLDQPAMERAVALVDQALSSYAPAEDPDSAVQAAAGTLAAHDIPIALRRVDGSDVTVTLWRPGAPPLRGRSAEGALFADLRRATRRALGSSENWRQWVAAAPRVRIQVDISGPPVMLSRRWAHPVALAGIGTIGLVSPRHVGRLDLVGQLIYEVEPGIDGLTLRSGDREATMLPADPVTFGWLTPRVKGRVAKVEALLHRLSKQAGGPPSQWEEAGTDLYKFRTFSFGRPSPETGGRVVRFYRGNALIESVSSQDILEGIREAGLWLNSVVRPNGTFDYEYLPNVGKNTPDYNAVRHAGTVYGLYHLYRLALREPRLRGDANAFLEAAIRSGRWLYPRLGPPPGAPDDSLVALIENKRDAVSGAAALTLMSFLERPALEHVSHPALREALDNPQDRAIIEGLGRFLLATIDAHGKVFANYTEARTLGQVEKEALYYPGEVMLALTRLYRATGESQWLAGAERVAEARLRRYRPRLQWRPPFYRPPPNPDHWVMQAMWELYELTGDERYADCGLAMGDQHAREQYPPNWQPFADYAGAYRRIDDLPRTTRACSRSEAMGGVVRIAWRRRANARPYEDALLNGAKHIIENQWRTDNSFFLPDFGKARGAIRMGVVDNHCRIDNNQHAVVGLTHALAVARVREGVLAPARLTLPPVPSDDEIEACRGRLARRGDRLPRQDVLRGSQATP